MSRPGVPIPLPVALVLLFMVLAVPLFLLSGSADAQSLPIGELEDEQLRLQLLLNNPEGISTVNRPFSLKSYDRVMADVSHLPGWWNRPIRSSIGLLPGGLPLGLQAGLHPVLLRATHNTRLPHGENNQAAWYGKGVNPEWMGGVWLSSDYLTISIQPHVVWQQNEDFLYPRFIFTDSRGEVRYIAEGIGTGLDAPFRFGPDPSLTFDWGYSSIKVHYSNLEAGVSSEPLWWGPAVRYALMMSNNAPGIPHAFVGTREPVRLPWVGHLHFRWIFGYPEESGYFDHPLSGRTRFINSLNVAWSPSIIPTLTLGTTRTYHQYEEDGFEWENVTAMFNPFQKTKEGSHSAARNQLFSIYGQLLVPEARAEIYGEFLREDHSYDMRDFLNEPHHNSAWAFGFQKLFDARFADFYRINVEFTNLTASQIASVRWQSYFYTHNEIRQGHTNRGHILGAAIGPGSNSQFLSLDGYRGDYKAGVFIQRIAENENFHLLNNAADDTPGVAEFGDYFRHRVNLNLGLNLLYGPGPFYLHGEFVWTKAYNYGRFDYGELERIYVTNYEHKDRINLQFRLGIRYVF